ncbi:MAG: ferritin-like domain-containing protein [Acidobacteriota bacterium]
MASPKSLQDLFLAEARDLYGAEQQLLEAMPKLAETATSEELRAAIESHLEETRTHVDRLEQVFDLLDVRHDGNYCAGIAGIIEEVSDLLFEDVESSVMDAAIVASAQCAEHYEIGAYGSLIAWANALGREEIAAVLALTLKEEKAADARLTALAEEGINGAAAVGRASTSTRHTATEKARV